MIITLIIYILIIIYIIIKGFYTFIKFFHNDRRIELFYDSIYMNSIPFYINMQKINLLCIFINLILISFIFLPNLMNDLIISISNSNITYCQDYISDKESNFNSNDKVPLSKLINETYEISNINRSYIYNINSKYIEINDHLLIFKGLSQNLEDIFNKQNTLLQEISSIKSSFEKDISGNYFECVLYEMMSNFKEIDQKCQNTLSLTSNAYNKMMLSYNNSNLFLKIFAENNINLIIRDFIGDHQVENLNKKVFNTFNALEEVQRISKENYDIVKIFLDNNQYIYPYDNIVIDIPKIKIINISEEDKIKNFNELYNYSNKKLLLTLKNKNIKNIHYNIDTFHKNLIYKNDTIEQDNIMLRGFFFKKNIPNNFFTDDSNFFDSIDKNMLQEYNNNKKSELLSILNSL